MSAKENSKPRSIFLLTPEYRDLIYSDDIAAQISHKTHLLSPPLDSTTWKNATPEQQQTEIIFSGWGMPKVDEEFLAHFPKLKIIFYGAGSIRGFTTSAMWKRGVRVTSAASGNAESVVEFAVGQILLAGKNALFHERNYRAKKVRELILCPGNYRTTLGLISLGWIGKKVVQVVKQFTYKVIAYDPFISHEEAQQLGVELVSLDDIFTRSDIISCHTPLLDSTQGMINERHFRAMKSGATFINTSRGAVVNEEQLCFVLSERHDIYAVLDVTTQEPLANDSPLWTLPNAWLTPHIAGCLHKECQRMGYKMLDELRLYLNGEKLHYELDEQRAKLSA